ncbi:PREDICTED: cytosolic endo-beta-N-acetylglucosaminidase-like [Priapulus caudatus]|uniref:mannosyl-glycoprotein endo-beta-N-acetylglucosaminidase n=1 Tax=Priapulus caudatus TaxID=37621 RepID=A0ABM1DVS0_PRICU|nr:PREDICTED: cytosolic endo-beta-N-acetylglucosaminidase-like [Priapulus caudatus]
MSSPPATTANVSRPDLADTGERVAVTTPLPTDGATTEGVGETREAAAEGAASDNANRPAGGVVAAATDDEDADKPQMKPLKTWEEVLAWEAGKDDFNVATVELAESVERPADLPLTFVCHDMAGGYLDDRFPQGSDSAMAYRHWHWDFVDIFNYFSHNFVTIPPSSWTNVAHAAGTLCLGTIITEWDAGAELCAKFLADWETCERFARTLIDICRYYRFDGYLVNIENPIVPGEQLVNLIYFVSHLTREMRAALPHARVVWYDSVTVTGELAWQNELNDDNKVFFDSSDGIFLNYGWTKETLASSAAVAGADGRLQDVYVGIDVFGRGVYGGGGFNTSLALEVIRDARLSAAIFAPGWVYQRLDAAKFVAHNDLFWSLAAPHCHAHAVRRRLLATSFCQGFGERLYERGAVASDAAWHNLARQHAQPPHETPADGRPHAELCARDAYSGGACLRVSGFTARTHVAQVALFRDLALRPGAPTLVSFSLKPIAMEGLHFSLLVRAEADDGTVHLYAFERRANATARGRPAARTDAAASGDLYRRYSSEDASSDTVAENGWISQLHTVNEAVGTITHVDAMIKICGAETIRRPPPVGAYSVSDVEVRPDAEGKTVSAVVGWEYKAGAAHHFVVHRRVAKGASFVYLCQVNVPMYKIVRMAVAADTSAIEIVAQPVSEAGVTLPLAKCEFVTIDLV